MDLSIQPMTRRTKTVDEKNPSEKSEEQALSVSNEIDMPAVCSIDKCGDDLSDISQCKELQDEIKMLEIQSHRLQLEERLQQAKEVSIV